jgi:transcriptional regulator with GAF, ATPase, and Fis domain
VEDERFSTMASENGDETDLTRLLERLDRTLAKEPLDFYSSVLPQAIAEEITTDVPTDMVAVLLDDGEESFRVAGSVGLAADEQDAVIDQNHEELRRALWNGVSVLQDTDAPGAAAAGIPGSKTVEALVLLPLIQGKTWLGMLLLGRRATLFNDKEIADAIACGVELASLVQSLLLAKQLRQCLGAFEPSSKQS